MPRRRARTFGILTLAFLVIGAMTMAVFTSRIGFSRLRIRLDLAASAPPAAPAAPTGLVAQAVSASQVQLTWDSAPGATGIVVERSSDGVTGWAVVATLGSGATAYTDGVPAASTAYFYRIKVTNGVAESAYSVISSATTPALPVAAGSAVLEDFSGAALRTAIGDAADLLWINGGENPGKAVILDTPTGTLKSTCVAISGPPQYSSNYVTFQDRPNGSFPFPGGYLQSYAKSGSVDWTRVKRVSFWIASDQDIPFITGAPVFHFGTYIREHGATNLGWQGSHYYHYLHCPVYAGRWTQYIVTTRPSHQVSASGYYGWPDDPEYQQGVVIVPASTLGMLDDNQTPYTLIRVAATSGSATLAVTAGTSVGAAPLVGKTIVLDPTPPGPPQASALVPLSGVYTITAASDTQITLDRPYAGTPTTGLYLYLGIRLPTQSADSGARAPVHYFDGMTQFYIDETALAAARVPPYRDWATDWLDDFVAEVPADPEPYDLVTQVGCVYNGTAYELAWFAVKMQAVDYSVYYAPVSMHANGLGAGTFGGNVTSVADAEAQAHWISPAMAEQPDIYFAIVPAGRSDFFEVHMPRRAFNQPALTLRPQGAPATLPAIPINSAGNVLTLVGSGTSWRTTPPTFGVDKGANLGFDGPSGLAVTAQSVVDDTHATVTVSCGTHSDAGFANIPFGFWVVDRSTGQSGMVYATPIMPDVRALPANAAGLTVHLTLDPTGNPGAGWAAGTTTFATSGNLTITNTVINSPTSATLTVTTGAAGPAQILGPYQGATLVPTGGRNNYNAAAILAIQ